MKEKHSANSVSGISMHVNLFRRKFEVLSNSLHPLLRDHHCLWSSKATEGSVGRKISATDSANSTIVWDLVYTVSTC